MLHAFLKLQLLIAVRGYLLYCLCSWLLFDVGKSCIIWPAAMGEMQSVIIREWTVLSDRFHISVNARSSANIYPLLVLTFRFQTQQTFVSCTSNPLPLPSITPLASTKAVNRIISLIYIIICFTAFKR